MTEPFVCSAGEMAGLLDALLASRDGSWWDGFFADRVKPCPFFTDKPDENLAGWFADGLLEHGRVLELGCGNGRNACFLARRGAMVDAVDFSAKALAWAGERAQQAGVSVRFQCCSIFDAEIADGQYDLVYDSGCFHHLPPHRRRDYVSLVGQALRPGGRYGLVCFRPEGGSGFTDYQVYERWSLGGGLGYTQERLRALWDTPPFSVRALRPMRKTGEQEPYFGEDFLWALLATKAD
jgi:SAM-dependent methyltransferase